jgi:hypothetical protein
LVARRLGTHCRIGSGLFMARFALDRPKAYPTKTFTHRSLATITTEASIISDVLVARRVLHRNAQAGRQEE